MSRKKNCFAFVALMSVGVVGAGCGTQPSVPVGVQPPTGTQPASQSYPPAAGADSAATSDGSVGSQPTVQLTAARVARDDADWSRFRGPDGMGASDSAKPPVEWSTTENVAWKTKLPGPGASSPIVFGDRIYLTCYTGYFVPDEPGGSLEQLRRHLIALRLSDGEIIWDKAIAAKLPEEERIRDHGFAANSAAADSERVYAFFGKTGV
ncbi:MAG: PQQ-binding-like beta-propeller repeat protein, partial [Planctomycetales bacterium]|nr:PQQ-binding-like beta-propeller repeat protein [Planctomycetales bacterium]